MIELHNNNHACSASTNSLQDQKHHEQNDTISDLNHSTNPRPITSLTRNLSEMSIECGTVPSNNPPREVNDDLNASSNTLLESKVKTVFELSESETLLNEFPCYLIRLVTIPGWMYVTDYHVCFYASLPGSKKGPYKGGYLSKKNHITSPRTNRYYFELRNHVLSWYRSAETKYLPLNSVDLKCITAIEPSKFKKYGIKLSTSSHHYTIIADSELSQKEWMDELQKGVFVAQHAGNSVRIVLPFSKITMVEKPSVFQFAANIKIKFMDDGGQEDYYFAFFPDIEEAYNGIITAWNAHTGLNSVTEKPPAGVKSNGSFLSFDSFLDNISPAALPTMLIGKLMNVTNICNGSNSTNTTTTTVSLTPQPMPNEEEYDSSDEEYVTPSEDIPSITKDINFTTSPKEIPASTSYLSAKKLKRNSLFFNKSAPEAISSETSSNNNSTDASLLETGNSSEKPASRPRSGTFNNLAKIPRAVTDAIKHQIKPDEATTQNRNRSSSINAIKQHIPPFNFYNKANKDSESSLPCVNTALTTAHSGDVSLISTTHNNNSNNKTRSSRATSIGSMILSGGSKTWHRLTPSNGDYYFQQQHLNENTHKHPKGPIWVNDKLLRDLKEAKENDSDTTSSDDDNDCSSGDADILTGTAKEEKDSKIMSEEQQTMNEHLNANFPMLLKTEVVEAVFKATFWRTIPYSGKIYITDRYFCFTSKVLAGQQKLIVPWTDVIQCNKIKKKSYYLLHGLTMIVKDLTDEIFFDFSSLSIRDHCYAVCQLKCESNKTLFESSSMISRNSRNDTFSMSSIILDRPEHIEPPLEYDGPPLLSNSSETLSPSRKYAPPEKSLHFTCLTIGSRGDVQPYLALCKELQKDGHRCRIATHPEYEDWVTHHGIEFRSIGGDPGELMKLCIDNSFLSVSFIKEGTKFFYSWFEALLQSAYDACQGTDAIIESPSAMIGIHMAEKLGVPYFRSMPFPFTRTTKFPHPFAVTQSSAGGRIYNDMTYVMIDMALWAGTSKHVNRFRRNVLKLPSTSLDRLCLWKVPYIYSFSPTVVHPPKDWPDFIHCTGYWFLDNPDKAWQPDPALVSFLEDDGRPIVYVGFGSIIVPDAEETTRIIVQAVLQSGVKAIICKGWSTRGKSDKKEDGVLLDQYPGTIHHLEAVPHDWLFPQIQGVVHHGGAGTTAAGLRAGLPTIIKPFFGDQRFWGQRIEELQVGLCLNKLNKGLLADALTTITQNKAMITKAALIGETIRKENGPRNAVENIYREFDYAKEQRIINNAS
ncbi:unnamed protein product [Mucor hiemalis]